MAHGIRAITEKLVFALALSFLGTQAMAAGALAIDSSQGNRYGFAHGYQSTNQAAEHALGKCGNGCQVVLDFKSGCGAYATDQSRGSTAYGWGTASSGNAAQNHALSACQSRGGSSCMVRSWACD
jgi:hypothetical protein